MVLSSTNSIPISEFGLKKLQSMIDDAESQLTRSLNAVTEAAGPNSDWHDNAPYDEANRSVEFWRARLMELNTDLHRVQLMEVEKDKDSKQIVFGSKVKIIIGNEQEKTYTILGPYEVDLSKGIISILSPLGEALLGKKEGESIDFSTTEGNKIVKIKRVDFISFDQSIS